MEIGTYVALGVAVAALAGVVVLGLGMRRERRRHADLLELYRAELSELAELRSAHVRAASTPTVAEFLITDAGEQAGDQMIDDQAIDDRVVLSAALGAPLVKAAAFGYGVRRALSPRSLNRIRFEMRREVRRARKERRREMRQAWRDLRAEENPA